VTTPLPRRMTIPLLVLGLAAEAVTSTRAQQQVFRSGVEVVSADVSVQRGVSPVLGLAADDFSVLDNGVKQHVAVLTNDAIPLDVTIVVDVSGSVGTPAIRRFSGAAQQIAAILHSADRVRIVAFGTDAQELAPLQPRKDNLELAPLTVRGSTSLNDALIYTAVTTQVAPDRRRLAVVFTDGFENSSLIGGDDTRSLLLSINTLIHVVLPSKVVPVMDQLSGGQASRRRLMELSVITGGEPHALFDDLSPDVVRPPSSDQLREQAVVKAFRGILDNFRQSYVLQYTVQGVPRAGWHDIAVSVVRPGSEKYSVRARKGYFGR